jgi:hypothetical protein
MRRKKLSWDDEEKKEAIESSLLGTISCAICFRILGGKVLSWRIRGINSGGRLVPFHRILNYLRRTGGKSKVDLTCGDGADVVVMRAGG